MIASHGYPTPASSFESGSSGSGSSSDDLKTFKLANSASAQTGADMGSNGANGGANGGGGCANSAGDPFSPPSFGGDDDFDIK